VAAAQVLDKRVPLDDDARGPVRHQPARGSQSGFQAAVISSARLFWYCSVLWNAAGIRSSITFVWDGGPWMTTSTGSPCAVGDAVKKLRAEAISLRRETHTSMRWRTWATAR
jgi:hypothetical protein